tara:strand:+ start:27 stop:320 length:294 start_codon:yes stop_codon:yes gene_type:complete
MKFPWNSSNEDKIIQNNNKEVLNNKESSKKKSKILDFNGKKYDIDSLPIKAKNLLKTLKIAENQYQINANKLQLIKLSKDSIIKQLENELKDIREIT